MSSGTDWVRVFFTASDYSTVHCHPDLTCRELVEKILSKRFPETPDIVRHYWISTERRNGAMVCPNLTYSEACVVYGGRIAAFYLKLRWLPACSQRDLAALELKLLEFIYKQAKEEHLLSVSTAQGGLRLGVINIALNQERPQTASESAIKRAAAAESKAIYKGAAHGHHMFPQVVLTDVKPKILRRYTADSLCDLWRRSRSTLLAEWFCLMLSELPAAFLPSVPCRVLLGARADARLAITRDGDIRLELRDSAPISVGRVQSLASLELCKSPEDSGVSLTIAFQPPLASLTVVLDSSRRADALLHLLLDAAHLSGCPEAAVTAMHPAHRCQRLLECGPDSDYSDLQPPPSEAGRGAATGAGGWYIDRRDLDLLEQLGSGEFSVVHKGLLQLPDGRQRLVAIKQPRSNMISGALVAEAESMRELCHPHIVEVLGICNDWVVLELALLGELRTHLQTRAPERCDPKQLTAFCVQLADAIQYLHSKDLLHRDVACRNVLLMQPTVIKLADFGLSRKLAANEEYYKASGGKLPIKWLPPEAYNARKFTPASDVWMLAVCCWEIYSCGEKPWSGLSNVDAIRKVEARVQLAKPLLCPLAAYNLLCLCWTYEPRLRPSAEQFRSRMAALTPEQLQVRNTTSNNNNIGRGNTNVSGDYYATSAATVSPRRPDSAGSMDDVFDTSASASPTPAALAAVAAVATTTPTSVAEVSAPPKPPMLKSPTPTTTAASPSVSPTPPIAIAAISAAVVASSSPADATQEQAVIAAAVSLVRALNNLVQGYVSAASGDPRQLIGHLRAAGAELKSLYHLVESSPQLAGSPAVQRQCQSLTRDLAQLVRFFRAAQAAYAAGDAARFQALMREMLKSAAALGNNARALAKAVR